jgi:triosephosphate isomerase
VSGRVPLVAGNWKMHKTEEEAEAYIQALLPRVSAVDGVEVAICVPFTALKAMVDSARGSRVEVYAQNMHQKSEGPMWGRRAWYSVTPSGESTSERPIRPLR